MMLRDELTNKQYSLNQRLRLFDMTVSATMLYGSAAWALTKGLETQIRSTQRKMLRLMLRYPRRVIDNISEGAVLETWVDWIRRATHAAEERLASLGLRDWVQSHYDSKAAWHAKLNESKGDNWPVWAHRWQPEGQRPQGRPRKRWADNI